MAACTRITKIPVSLPSARLMSTVIDNLPSESSNLKISLNEKVSVSELCLFVVTCLYFGKWVAKKHWLAINVIFLSDRGSYDNDRSPVSIQCF